MNKELFMEKREQIEKKINQFIDAAKKQHIFMMSGNSRSANIQAKKIRSIFAEIREIGPDGREALLEQIDNKDDAVAALAATYSLKFNTEKSLNTLKRISQKNAGIISFEASQSILRWEEGVWQLE